MPSRSSKKVFTARSQREGAGFIIRRSIGSSNVTTEETDPFLMLDELPLTDYRPGEFAGAPMHPHRGMDTVMYVKRGTCGHKDSMGNSGVLTDGDCQWMTAASGIEHDEGTGHPGGPLHGFQCWINLPSKNKMDPPAYNDSKLDAFSSALLPCPPGTRTTSSLSPLRCRCPCPDHSRVSPFPVVAVTADSIPVVKPADGISAKVIVGQVGDCKSLITPILKVQYLDFMCEANSKYEHALDASYETCIVHVYRGAGTFGASQTAGKEGQCLLFGPGDSLAFSAGAEGVDFLLLAGVPLKEPVVWHGPFVMNTQEQIMQCFQDYQSGQFIKHKGVYRKL